MRENLCDTIGSYLMPISSLAAQQGFSTGSSKKIGLIFKNPIGQQESAHEMKFQFLDAICSKNMYLINDKGKDTFRNTVIIKSCKILHSIVFYIAANFLTISVNCKRRNERRRSEKKIHPPKKMLLHSLFMGLTWTMNTFVLILSHLPLIGWDSDLG